VPELKLNRYIAISFLFHFLLLTLLVSAPSQWVVRSAVFNVNIVDYIEIPAPPKEGSRAQGFKDSMITPPQNIEGEKPNTKPQTQNSKPQTPVLPSETIHREGAGTDSPKTLEGLEGSKGDTLSEENRDLPFELESIPLKPKPHLFDREILEKFAKKAPEEKELTFDVREFRHRGYLRMLKEKIESIWKYPPEAGRRGISGDLYIRFSIRRDGRLGEVELLRTSGYKDLDDAAIKALRDAEPYWPLPKDWDKDSLEIIGHFIYLLGRSYVM